MRALLLLVLIALMAGCGSRQRAEVPSQSGELDPAFSEDGIVTRDFFRHGDIADQVVVTRTGRILVTGRAERDDFGRGSSVIAAFAEDGSVDTSFGEGGVVRRSLGGQLVETRDGRLLQVGSRGGAAAVARLEPNGTPDESFGTGGTRLFAQRSFRRAGCVGAEAIAIMRGGRMVIAGGLGCGGEDGDALGVFVARLRRDGRLDRSFSRDGVWLSHASCGVADIALDRHRRVLIGGSTGSSDYCTGGAMVVTRLRSNGVPDAQFGMAGRRILHFPHAHDATAFTFLRGARGRMLLGGSAGSRLAVARLRADGRPDKSFGRVGRVVRRTGPRTTNYVTDMVETPDGRLTLSVADDRRGKARFVVMRLRRHGTSDRGFGPNGTRVIAFDSDFARAYDLAGDRQGRVIAAGFAKLKETDNDFAIARLRP